MCGINGFQGDFSPLLLDAMNEVISYRGPDDSGTFLDSESRTGLAHRRLSIIDLSSLGKQPMRYYSESAVITFNGEIYNYRELRQTLLSQGYRFHSATDTEVILALYFRYGTDMLSQLNGMFAFAIFDARDRSLFLARDGLGIKPLYYAEVPKGFIFSSELKGILMEPSISREVSAQAINAYLTYLWCPAPDTMLKAVKKLEPGWALRVKEGRIVSKWQFYELPYGATPDHLTVEEATELCRDALNTAVERQMVSDAPLGAFLSGGLDSSSIVAMARHHQLNEPLKCYCIKAEKIVEEGFRDDAEFAKRLAKELGVELNVINADLVSPTDLAEMVYHLDEPQADPAGLLVRHICRLAKDQGVKVLLSGTGADDILCGYRRHQAIAAEKYWSWLPHTARAAIRSFSRRLPSTRPSFRRVRKAFEYADSNNSDRIVGYLKWIDPELVATTYGDRLRNDLANTDFASDRLHESIGRLPLHTPALTKLLFLDAKHFLTDHNLNYTDKMSMAEGVEVRVPYLDPDFIALAAKMPTEYKQHGLTGKWILRRAMQSELPREILHRSKTGFAVPVRAWFRDPMPEIFRELLSETVLGKRQWFDPGGVKSLIQLNERGIVDAAYPLLGIVCIEMWLQTFVDPVRPRPLS